MPIFIKTTNQKLKINEKDFFLEIFLSHSYITQNNFLNYLIF